MILVAYYLLKVIICSGILYGYYLLALRNKIFHGWNRFYLLSAIILSLVVPLIKIDIFQTTGGPTQVIQLLQVVTTGDEFVYEYTKNGGFHINATNISVIIYTVVSIFLIGFLIQTLFKIAKLKKDNSKIMVDGINFINTQAEGTPFSFFNDIFWNDKIDINSATGKQIFKHEVAHVQEKHSYDKILINIVLIFFWCNPFFWLIRKELNIIHEFIADKKALEDSDTAAFAAMILQATYPQQRFTITNNFFYSPLKRRLIMLTKNKNPRINYLSRLLVLPLVTLVFFSFTLKMKKQSTQYSGKKITVEIDAGDTIPNKLPTDSQWKKAPKSNQIKINKPSSVKNRVPQYYNGKKIKSAYGSNKLNKAIIVYENGTSDTLPIVEAEKLRIIPPPPPKVARDADKVFIKVEVEPSFPGGHMAWTRYIKKVIETNINELTKENKSGTCRVRFIVHEDGSISNAEALTMKVTKLAEIAVNAINKGPRWIPAKQNDRVVKAYREQPVTFTIKEMK